MILFFNQLEQDLLHMNDQEELYNIIDFEQILRKLSTKLISTKDIGGAITYSLKILGNFLQADAGYLYLLNTNMYAQTSYQLAYNWQVNFDLKLPKIIESDQDLLSILNSKSAVNIILNDNTGEIRGILGFISNQNLKMSNRYIMLLDTIFLNALKRKSAEDLLIRQREELSQFVGTIVHDIRNFLATIEGYASLLVDYNDYNPAYVKKIIKQVHQIEDLMVHSLHLANAGLIVDNVEEVNLNDIVYKIAQIIIEPANVILECEQLPTIRGDYEKVLQIFKNILENALENAAKSISIRYAEGFLYISNDGEQIPDEKRLNLLTTPTTFRRQKTGLGLKIVRKLVEAHGWKIVLSPGVSTTFIIQLNSADILDDPVVSDNKK